MLATPTRQGDHVLRQLYDDTHELFRESFRSFVHREMKPHLEKWERDGIVDRDLFRKAGEAGFLGMAVPESLGGFRLADFQVHAIIADELLDPHARANG